MLSARFTTQIKDIGSWRAADLVWVRGVFGENPI